MQGTRKSHGRFRVVAWGIPLVIVVAAMWLTFRGDPSRRAIDPASGTTSSASSPGSLPQWSAQRPLNPSPGEDESSLVSPIPADPVTEPTEADDNSDARVDGGRILVRLEFESMPDRELTTLPWRDVTTAEVRIGIARVWQPSSSDESVVSAPFSERETDSDGTVVFRGLETGEYEIRVTRPLGAGMGGPTVRAPIETLDDTREVTLSIPALGGVRGRVVDANRQPLAGATVRLRCTMSHGTYGHTERTNGVGEFSMVGIGIEDRASYQLTVKHFDHADEIRRDLALVPWDVSDVGTLTMRERTGYVSGRIVDREGRPVVAVVQAIPLSDSARVAGKGHAASRPDGSFRLAGIGTGRYRLRLPGEREWVEPVEFTCTDVELDAELGDLVVESAPHRVVGRVVSRDGEPLVRALVLASKSDGGAHVGSAITDADGGFAIETDDGGPFTLSARCSLGLADGYETSPDRVPPFSGRLDNVIPDGVERTIVIGPAGLLLVLRSDDVSALRDARSMVVAVRRERASDWIRHGGRGSWVAGTRRFRLTPIAGGTVTIRVEVPGFKPVERTEVVPFDVAEREYEVGVPVRRIPGG